MFIAMEPSRLTECRHASSELRSGVSENSHSPQHASPTVSPARKITCRRSHAGRMDERGDSLCFGKPRGVRRRRRIRRRQLPRIPGEFCLFLPLQHCHHQITWLGLHAFPGPDRLERFMRSGGVWIQLRVSTNTLKSLKTNRRQRFAVIFASTRFCLLVK